jgi:hypothetical protein
MCLGLLGLCNLSAADYSIFRRTDWRTTVQKFVEYSSEDWATEWYLSEVDILIEGGHVSTYEWMTKEQADGLGAQLALEEEFGRRLARRRRLKPQG